MDISQPRIDNLLATLSESLNVEVKQWIDTSLPEGVAKIAKACLALRNRNGGYLVIGFDDETLQPTSEGRPDDLHRVFHLDTVQVIVSKYAAIPFEVRVGFGALEGK